MFSFNCSPLKSSHMCNVCSWYSTIKTAISLLPPYWARLSTWCSHVFLKDVQKYSYEWRGYVKTCVSVSILPDSGCSFISSISCFSLLFASSWNLAYSFLCNAPARFVISDDVTWNCSTNPLSDVKSGNSLGASFGFTSRRRFSKCITSSSDIPKNICPTGFA